MNRLLMLAACVFMFACGGGPEHDKITAYVMCEDWVKARLKSPGTADFSDVASSSTTDLGTGKYQVNSYVDSQNGFGALLRSKFSCTTQWVSGSTWRLEDLSIAAN